MDANIRREKILNLLKVSNEPFSGASLANQFNVTRQVIVQDIALLRAEKNNIISTSRGYLLYENKLEKPKRLLAVKHSRENIIDELCTIIDNGGTVLDVVVEHPIYEEITVNLILKSRRDIDKFIEHLNNNKTEPLMHLTGGEHYHTVEADNENTLDLIEEQLNNKGYLLNQ